MTGSEAPSDVAVSAAGFTSSTAFNINTDQHQTHLQTSTSAASYLFNMLRFLSQCHGWGLQGWSSSNSPSFPCHWNALSHPPPHSLPVFHNCPNTNSFTKHSSATRWCYHFTHPNHSFLFTYLLTNWNPNCPWLHMTTESRSHNILDITETNEQ